MVHEINFNISSDNFNFHTYSSICGKTRPRSSTIKNKYIKTINGYVLKEDLISLGETMLNRLNLINNTNKDNG